MPGIATSRNSRRPSETVGPRLPSALRFVAGEPGHFCHEGQGLRMSQRRGFECHQADTAHDNLCSLEVKVRVRSSSEPIAGPIQCHPARAVGPRKSWDFWRRILIPERKYGGADRPLLRKLPVLPRSSLPRSSVCQAQSEASVRRAEAYPNSPPALVPGNKRDRFADSRQVTSSIPLQRYAWAGRSVRRRVSPNPQAQSRPRSSESLARQSSLSSAPHYQLLLRIRQGPRIE